jgi:hypothetical protein
LPGVHLPAEAADEGTHGVVAVAPMLGDIRHRQALDEDGAQDLVLAVDRVGGLEKEGTVGAVVHGPASACGAFSGVCAAIATIVRRGGQGADSRGMTAGGRKCRAKDAGRLRLEPRPGAE